MLAASMRPILSRRYIRNPVLFFYNVHLSANPCSTCGGPLYPDFQIPMEIINPSYIVPLYLYKLSLHNIHYASTFNLLTTCGFYFLLSSNFQRTIFILFVFKYYINNIVSFVFNSKYLKNILEVFTKK